jgi:hypothetical protein
MKCNRLEFTVLYLVNIAQILKLLLSILTIIGSLVLQCLRIDAIINKDFSLLKDFSASVVKQNLFLLNSSFIKFISKLTTLDK